MRNHNTAIAATMFLLVSLLQPTALANSIESVDTAGNVGIGTSLALDSSGHPVVSYFDRTNRDLKVLHCNDANCAGGDESIETVDTSSGGFSTSLALDGSGYPVVSYVDAASRVLKVLHCNDVNCTGGDESIETVDTSSGGFSTSLALDGSGYPVVSYTAALTGDLKVLHCNDVNCTGGDESIEVVPTLSLPAWVEVPSLALDDSGNPVVSYVDITQSAGSKVFLVHCNDVNCTGGDESHVRVGRGGQGHGGDSLALDSSGNPVVSFYDPEFQVLKVLHCNDVNCTGGDESIERIATAGDVNFNCSSLALDSSGNPVVSFQDGARYQVLKVLHCNDANCAGGDESIETVDTARDVGCYNSLALDSSGNPVVSYFDEFNEDLKVLHCNNVNCATAATIDIKPGSDPNSINLKSKGNIPVAILTTDAFDATQVDWETVLFGPDGASESHGRAHVKDVDRDSDMDMVLHFKTQETGIQCGDTEATLTGETFDGRAFAGTDAIKTVKCPAPVSCPCEGLWSEAIAVYESYTPFDTPSRPEFWKVCLFEYEGDEPPGVTSGDTNAHSDTEETILDIRSQFGSEKFCSASVTSDYGGNNEWIDVFKGMLPLSSDAEMDACVALQGEICGEPRYDPF